MEPSSENPPPSQSEPPLRRRLRWWIFGCVVLIGAGLWWWLVREPPAIASENKPPLAVPPPPDPDQRLTPSAVENMSYALPDGRVTFGRGEQTSSSGGVTAVLSGFQAFGHLNDDSDGDAAVIVNQKTGEGTRSYLFGLLFGVAGPAASEPILLGTGLALETLTVMNGYVEVAWRAPKAKTGTVKRYWLKDAKLVLDPAFE